MDDEKGMTHITEAPATPSVGEDTPPSSSKGPLYLIVLSGGIPGAMLPLVKGGNWLGRAADNSLQLPEPSISRHHAVLKATDDEQVVLTDLSSSNGTFVNGRRLTPHQALVLNDGDRIRLGANVVVKFVRPDPCEEQFQREMFERVVRDSLTGLYNRAYFLDQVVPLAQRAAIKGLGIAVLMLDIDHFKGINDAHGHDAGDAVLREVAEVFRRATRSDDLVARYGGEEFVLALPVDSLECAASRAERIRAALAERPLRTRSQPLHVTASIGVAFSTHDRVRTAAALISAADLNLYRAKESGRNRVVYLDQRSGIAESQLTVDGETPSDSYPGSTETPRTAADMRAGSWSSV